MRHTSNKALSIFRRKGGVLHTAEAVRGGIHPRTLYKLRDENQVVQISRGVYRLADLPEITNPDLVTVATRIPDSIVCLISALAFHEITTEIPCCASARIETTASRLSTAQSIHVLERQLFRRR